MTKEELEERNKTLELSNDRLRQKIDRLNDEIEDLEDSVDSLEEEEIRLNELLDEWEEKQTLDSSNLMEQQKAELLVKAQKRFTLEELEEMFGGNSFNL